MFDLCWHKWGKWSRPMDTYSGHKSQFRECKKCGMAQRRIMPWDKQTNLKDINDGLDSIKQAEEL